MRHFRTYIFLLMIIPFFGGCIKYDLTNHKTVKNVVVIVVDGPRYSETWGDSTHQHIPNMAEKLAPEGVIFANFWNNGSTFTNGGHTALLTGHYQDISNAGMEKPDYPNYLNYWLKSYNKPKEKAWFFCSKDKIEILADSKDTIWEGNYVPSVDCGNHGLGTGYRTDSVTLQHAMDTMTNYRPNLVFINLREPDYTGHTGNYENYIAALEKVDEQYYAFWEFLTEHEYYKHNTAIFITNDHGRHLDEVGSFANHGDNCVGCRKINLYAYGPGFGKNRIVDQPYEQIDLTTTIAELLGMQMETSDGEVIDELFE